MPPCFRPRLLPGATPPPPLFKRVGALPYRMQALRLAGTNQPVARVPGIGVFYNELLLGEGRHMVQGWNMEVVRRLYPPCQPLTFMAGPAATRPHDHPWVPAGVPPVLERFMSLVPALHEVVIFLTGTTQGSCSPPACCPVLAWGCGTHASWFAAGHVLGSRPGVPVLSAPPTPAPPPSPPRSLPRSARGAGAVRAAGGAAAGAAPAL